MDEEVQAEWKVSAQALKDELKEVSPDLSEEDQAREKKKLMYQIAKVYDEAGEVSSAQEYLLMAAQEWEKYPVEAEEKAELLLNLAGTFLDQNQIEEAAAHYQELIDLGKTSYQASAYYHLGRCALFLKDWDLAIQSQEQAIGLYKAKEDYANLGKVWHNQALAYLQLKDSAAALGAFEQAIHFQDLAKDHLGLFQTLGNVHIFIKEMMRSPNQLTFYDRNIEQSAEEGRRVLTSYWYYQRGLWYEEENQAEAAQADFQKALEIQKENEATLLRAYLYYHSGALYEEFGDHPAAIEYHRLALEGFLAEKHYEKVSLTAYYLENSLSDISQIDQKEEIQTLLDQVAGLSLIPEEVPESEEDERLLPEDYSREELEILYEEYEMSLPNRWLDFFEVAEVLAQHYQEQAQNAWLGKKRKKLKLENFKAEFLETLQKYLDLEKWDEEALKYIPELKQRLAKIDV